VADIAIVGAGPYGIVATAALRNLGMKVSALGSAMSSWERMPAGMLLRSPYVASSIGDPAGRLSLDAFADATGTAVSRPIPLASFVDYGRWVQERAVPDLEERQVACVERKGGAYRLLFHDGGEMVAGRVVVAAGIGYFRWVPPVFRGWPAEQVSHSSAHRDPSVFTGRRVLVIGAGQSALESAALLAESGAHVQIAVRGWTVHWLRRHPWLRRLGPVSSLLYAPAEVGPPLLCRLVESPDLVRRLPAARRDQLAHRSIRPAGAGWLRGRVEGPIPIFLGHDVGALDGGPDGLAVEFRNGRKTVVDHVLLGTGYRVELSRYPFLPRELLSDIDLVDGYPVLRRGFESSLPGLHFLGAPAAWTFGPLMRFVAGTRFAAAELRRWATSGRSHRVASAV
jgi:hypothetical protein